MGTDRQGKRLVNDTASFYRYFDATPHCEYLFKCAQNAVEQDLPRELSFLAHRDSFHERATQIADMSERKHDVLLKFLRQNRGTLSKRARTVEFEHLTDEETCDIESIYRDLFA